MGCEIPRNSLLNLIREARYWVQNRKLWRYSCQAKIAYDLLMLYFE